MNVNVLGVGDTQTDETNGPSPSATTILNVAKNEDRVQNPQGVQGQRNIIMIQLKPGGKDGHVRSTSTNGPFDDDESYA